MGNVETHDVSPVTNHLRHHLDLSIKVDHKTFHKHVSGQYTEGAIVELPWNLRDSVSLFQSLNVSFNALTSLPPEIPFRLPHLRYLDLSYNRLSSLPRSLGLLFHLEELLLVGNRLSSIPDTLVLPGKLRRIDLSHNEIALLPEDLGKMPALEKLNVSHNRLVSLPRSLGECGTLRILLASSNPEMLLPPVEVCNSGSEEVLRYLRGLAVTSADKNVPSERNVFPRVWGVQVLKPVPNLHSAHVQYIQIQTETMNTASRIKTPLLPPLDATLLEPSTLRDRIIGLLYGAAIGDALGVATEFLTTDECAFHYDQNNLNYASIIRDQHRVHWERGDWTCNADQMFLVLDSLLHWAGVVDELDFAKRLLAWKKSGFSELGDTEGFLLSDLTKLVLQEPGYVGAPHQVALQVYQRCQQTCCNGVSTAEENGRSVLVDNGSLTRTLVLGIPVFHNVVEVASNSLRICQATHPEEQCMAASVTLSTILATILQGRHNLYMKSDVHSLLDGVCALAEKQLANPGNLKCFRECFQANRFDELALNDAEKCSHPFKALAAGVVALKQCRDFKHTLSCLAMQGGHSSVNCCVAGAFLGCRDGFSCVPRPWVEGLLPKQKEWLNERINNLLDKMGLP